MARKERRQLLVCVIVHTSVHAIHTSATTVVCNDIKDCLKLEICRINYPGILKIHKGNIREFCLLDMLGPLVWGK